MSDEIKTISPASESEPAVSLATVPMWLMMLMMLLLFLGAWYFDKHSGWFQPKVYGPYASLAQVQLFQPPSGGDQEIKRGKVVYETVCALCHNPDGLGKPNQAPKLAGSDWVTGNVERLIRIPLNGLDGPIEVGGQKMTFPASMPAMGAAMSDADLAAVLTYMRQAWGNKASAVTPEQVKKVRDEFGKRTQPWHTSELQSMQ